MWIHSVRRCGPAMRCSGGKNGVKISCGMRMARSMLKLKCVFGSENHDFHRKFKKIMVFMICHEGIQWKSIEMQGKSMEINRFSLEKTNGNQ